MTSPKRYAKGWSPESAARARERTAFARTGFRSGAKRPRAISLTKYRRRILNQYDAGTCWLHAAVRLAETVMEAEGQYFYAPLCRMLVGYEGKLLEGGGNPDDGGNVTDALTAMRRKPNGLGNCHEDLWPYITEAMPEKVARIFLGSPPPPGALSDIGFYLDEVADARDDDEALHNIAQGRGNGIGIFWPEAWDDPTKATAGCLYEGYGEGGWGHALYEAGYVMPGVWPGELGKHGWIQIDNSHGEIYDPLPTELAALVPGYKPTSPDKTTDFFVRADVYSTLIHDPRAERVTASGASGWNKIADWDWTDIV